MLNCCFKVWVPSVSPGLLKLILKNPLLFTSSGNLHFKVLDFLISNTIRLGILVWFAWILRKLKAQKISSFHNCRVGGVVAGEKKRKSIYLRGKCIKQILLLGTESYIMIIWYLEILKDPIRIT